MRITAVIVARFQTPYLHEGHKHLLNEIRAKHNKVIVVLGVSPVKGSRRNPFDFYTREKLLKQFASELVVLPLSDYACDETWSRQLDLLLMSTFPSETFMLYGGRDGFIPFYSGHLQATALPEYSDQSATVIREENSDKVLESVDFRLGINYAYQNEYAKVYPTVDIAVLKDDNTKVLLGKKHHATQWRFPGGFADPEDGSFEKAAKRELGEECGDIETGPMQYVGSAKMDGWRYRTENDKIITTFFRTSLLYGHPKAGDDLAEVEWFNLEELPNLLQNGLIATEHVQLVEMLINNLK